AEALSTLHPAAGATAAIVEFVGELRHAALSDEVRHYARRHLLDTVGVMIAGAGGDVASRAEAVLAAARPAGRIPVAGRAPRAGHGGPMSSTPLSSAAPPPTASNSTTASGRARCIRAAWWCLRRWRSATTDMPMDARSWRRSSPAMRP